LTKNYGLKLRLTVEQMWHNQDASFCIATVLRIELLSFYVSILYSIGKMLC
jgi:hypothetical protein